MLQVLNYAAVIVGHLIFVVGFMFAGEMGLHPIEVNMLRGIATTVTNVPYIMYKGEDLNIKLPINYKYCSIRYTAIAYHSSIFALVQMCLSQPLIQSISSSGPIFVLILNYLIYGVDVSKSQVKGIMLTMVGILLTINGKIFTELLGWEQIQTNQGKVPFQNYVHLSSFQRTIVIAFLTSAVASWAAGQIVVKQTLDLASYQINADFGLFLIFFTGLLYPFVPNPKPVQQMALGLLYAGLPMAIGNVLYVYAIKVSSNTGLATMCITSAVFFGYFISIFRYHEALNYICLIGSGLIIAGLAFTLFQKTQSNLELYGLLSVQSRKSRLSNMNLSNSFLAESELREGVVSFIEHISRKGSYDLMDRPKSYVGGADVDADVNRDENTVKDFSNKNKAR